ncbi:MAG TPA: hypothetical protein VHX13_04210 [Acidobacteriaceae bacterium]|jgi:hypothetical protein|nr:hypothetical protein [Acidobacteriaceae bacterium]
MMYTDYTIFPEDAPPEEYRPPVNPAQLQFQMSKLLEHENTLAPGRISSYNSKGEEIDRGK